MGAGTNRGADDIFEIKRGESEYLKNTNFGTTIMMLSNPVPWESIHLPGLLNEGR